MRLNNTVAGWLLVLFGATVVIYARTFPAAPGQPIGPGMFPIVIGAGLLLCGIVLIWSERTRHDLPAIELEEWLRRPRMALNAVLVIGALIFYAVAVDTVGFFITAFVFLAGLFLAFGVRGRWIAPTAVVVTLGLHFAFYTLLRVPLPWGWLEALAW
jgi:putative tricarboxylic transport membrane protein